MSLLIEDKKVIIGPDTEIAGNLGERTKYVAQGDGSPLAQEIEVELESEEQDWGEIGGH